MIAWHQGSSVLTRFVWMAAGPVCWDATRALSLRRDLRYLLYLVCCSPTSAASWAEHYAMHGLPAAALPEALSKLRHPLVPQFLLSHKDSTTDSLSCH